MFRVAGKTVGKVFGIGGACGLSYMYGKYNITPQDVPLMAIRSGRLPITVSYM